MSNEETFTDGTAVGNYKRLRYGPMGTGIYSALSLPGVKKRKLDPTREGEKDPEGLSEASTSKERKHIYFDGNANQLHYPDDMFYAGNSGLLYAKQRDEHKNRNFISRVGDLSAIAGASAGIPYFRDVVPSRSEKEIADTADRALAALQKEVDTWTRDRFYIFAGGDHGGNRVLDQFAYPNDGRSQVVTDHYPVGDGVRKPGFNSSELEQDGRLNALYAKHVRFDLSNAAVCNFRMFSSEPIDMSKHRRLHFTMWFGEVTDAIDPPQFRFLRINGKDIEFGELSKVTETKNSFYYDIPESHDMSSVEDFFFMEMAADVNEARVHDIFLTNMWLEYTPPKNPTPEEEKYRLFDRCFVKSWNTVEPDLHFDVILQNTCFTYDQTLAIYALLGAGDIERVILLLRALLLVIGQDPEYDDNRVRNAYRCGPAEKIPGDQYGPVYLPGWYGREAYTTEAAKEEGKDKEPAGNLNTYGQDPYAISTWTGTAAWVMMCLGSCYRLLVTHPEYEDTDLVKEIFDKWLGLSEWVVYNFRADTDYFKGFMGGFYGFSTIDYNEGEEGVKRVPKGVYKTQSGEYEGPGQFILQWRSTEHMADLYAAFRHLFEVTGDPRWGDNMRHALEYIDKNWYDGTFDETDNGGKRFDTMSLYLTGNGEIDKDFWYAPQNKANLPTDPSVWVTYGTDRLDATRMRSMKWMHENCRIEGGNPNSMWKYSEFSKAGWIEGAGQSAILFKAYGLPTWWLAALAPCVDHQLETGLMYSVTETAGTGFTLPNVGLQDQPWKYFRRGHMGATSWFLIGWLQINPFKFPVDFAADASISRIRHMNVVRREMETELKGVMDDKDEALRAQIRETMIHNQDGIFQYLLDNLRTKTEIRYIPLEWRTGESPVFTYYDALYVQVYGDEGNFPNDHLGARFLTPVQFDEIYSNDLFAVDDNRSLTNQQYHTILTVPSNDDNYTVSVIDKAIFNDADWGSRLDIDKSHFDRDILINAKPDGYGLIVFSDHKLKITASPVTTYDDSTFLTTVIQKNAGERLNLSSPGGTHFKYVYEVGTYYTHQGYSLGAPAYPIVRLDISARLTPKPGRSHIDYLPFPSPPKLLQLVRD